MTDQMTLDSLPTAAPTALIQLTSLTQIQEHLMALRERWEQYAADAEAMICTEDTVQAIKSSRAAMRKEYDEADAQRMAAKVAYMAPWDAVEETYKSCVKEAFSRADAALKGKIDAFEGELKERCRSDLQGYFSELCAAHGVDFLDFDTALLLGGIKIGLADAKSKTGKKLKTDLGKVVAKVARDMYQIRQMDEADQPEIMDEYKRCFYVGAAVCSFAARKKRIEAEREAAEVRRKEQEAAQEALERVQSIRPAVAVEAPPTDAERLYKVTFTVLCTKEQGRRLKSFLAENGIKFE